MSALRLILMIGLLWLPLDAMASDYNIPDGWKNTVSNVSRAERLSTAEGIASELRHRVDPSLGYPADSVDNETIWAMVIKLADQDRISGNTNFMDPVVNNTLQLFEFGNADDDSYKANNIDNAGFGFAEIVAYQAYRDASRLAAAQKVFDLVYSDFVTVSGARTGKYPRPFNTVCGQTLGGMIFNGHLDLNDISVRSSSMSPWIALCAHLYEHTQNSTYLTAAQASIQFMQAYLIRLDDAGLSIGVTFNVTTTCTTDSEGVADNFSPYMEGLSIIANLTANQAYGQLWLKSLVPAVLSFRDWHSSDGILTEDTTTYPSKWTLMRGLLEVRLRNPSNTDLCTLIDSYITVQFNAVRTNANIGSNDYAVSWHGGGSSQYSTVGNVEALAVLSAASAIAPANASQPSTGSSSATPSPSAASPSPNTTSHPRHHVPVRVIAGAAAGGTVAVGIFTLIICMHRRRRGRKRKMLLHSTGIDTAKESAADRLMPDPFIQRTPLYAQSMSSPRKGDLRRPVTFSEQTVHGDSWRPPSDRVDVDVNAHDPTSAREHEIRPADGQPDAWHDMERRLETRLLNNLIRTFAGHGETESNPPEYDGPRS
ncbi:unnamed protein product [Peniophora sp. CBMAI 1063]|nr:unnamed protein product [Peniophora sp. CBMAI 1063]